MCVVWRLWRAVRQGGCVGGELGTRDGGADRHTVSRRRCRGWNKPGCRNDKIQVKNLTTKTTTNKKQRLKSHGKIDAHGPHATSRTKKLLFATTTKQVARKKMGPKKWHHWMLHASICCSASDLAASAACPSAIPSARGAPCVGAPCVVGSPIVAARAAK